MRSSAFLLLAVLALVVVLVVGCKPPVDPPAPSAQAPPEKLDTLDAATATEGEAATPAQDAEQAAPSADGGQEPSAGGSEVAWLSDHHQALDEAGKSGKLVMIDIFSHSCPPCRQMDEETWPSPKVVKASSEFVCLRVNSDENSEVPGKYNTMYIPHILFVKPDGSVVAEDTGFKSPDDLVAMMDEARKK